MPRRLSAAKPRTVLDEVQEYIAGNRCDCDWPEPGSGEVGIIVCWRCRFASAVARQVHAAQATAHRA